MTSDNKPVFMKNKDDLWFNQWELLVFHTMYEFWLLKDRKTTNLSYREVFLLDKHILRNRIQIQDPKFTMKKFDNLAKKIKNFEIKNDPKKRNLEIKMDKKTFDEFKFLYEVPEVIKDYYWTPEEL